MFRVYKEENVASSIFSKAIEQRDFFFHDDQHAKLGSNKHLIEENKSSILYINRDGFSFVLIYVY